MKYQKFKYIMQLRKAFNNSTLDELIIAKQEIEKAIKQRKKQIHG